MSYIFYRYKNKEFELKLMLVIARLKQKEARLKRAIFKFIRVITYRLVTKKRCLLRGLLIR